MTEILKCDKCRKIIKKDTAVKAHIFYADLDSNLFDLCAKCAKPFVKYIKNFLKK